MYIPTELFVLIGAASAYGGWRLFAALLAAEEKSARGLLLLRFAVSDPASRQRILDEESKRWAFWDRRCLVITRYWRKRRDKSILATTWGRWIYKVKIAQQGHFFTLEFYSNHPAWKTRQQSKSLIDAYLAIERKDAFHDLEHHWHR